MPSCRSYCHCTTSSNSHTVVLSKPASYSPALFSVPVKIHEHAYQSVMVVSRYGESTAVLRLQYVSGCGKSTIRVRQKYAGSKAYVWLKYGKSTVCVCVCVCVCGCGCGCGWVGVWVGFLLLVSRVEGFCYTYWA